ncbi:heparan-alpha-glucosaminide N-acetyltransferase domain-containing protein [Arenibacter sp. GZD96]|uniref:DUF1624 domain-containing protein n=1 Tax=Aurantibrevibacter litoralis TaxID=3106030 RepID=UPI002AFFAF65|nr:heparan-alpha-glucosaminide N-acetyltransferase domain-containing protein [Arenibacter sp. GZD-96]MEA1786159.1 heparan-alpha-glucosaminide N-acetyltransferase domain-containing protein [Arenibacter sp. GZD-96]
MTNRIQSVDFLKGLVIVLMALDHVRDYFHIDTFYFDPTEIEKTNFWLFFTRFITHFCAPVFVFLAGTSAFFVEQKIGKNAVSKWLLKRGLWLIFVEVVIISFGWRFQFNFDAIIFQVIWLLGASMLFLALFIHFPKKLMIPLCLLVIIGHNFLDMFSGEQGGFWWILFHEYNMIQLTDSITIVNAYPLIPWIFVMPLGYYLGILYKPGFDAVKRRQILLRTGISAIVLFFVLRFANVYGDLVVWSSYDDFTKTALSFFNVTKYPPSLLYLLITLGPSLIVLSLAEKFKGKIFDVMVLFGKVPMFFYIVHIYWIHLLAVPAVYLSGYDPKLMIIDVWIGFVTELQGYGLSLGIVYLIWLFVVASLYPLCKWYWNYKKKNRKYWWLSYL